MIGWNEEIKKELGSCGKNVFIGFNTIFVNPKNVHLGDNVRIDSFSFITSNLVVGNNVHICSHVVLGGGSRSTIKLGNWTFIGYGSKLFCASEDYSGEHGPVNETWGNNKTWRGDIIFNDYSGIASDVIVMPNIEMPIGCTIGAQSLVYKNSQLSAWSVYMGNPLKFHKERNREKVISLSNTPSFLKNNE